MREWLSPPNIRDNHIIKYDNIMKSDGGRAKRTTTWLTEGDIVFVDWKTEPNSSLWIQGKGVPLPFVSSQTLIASNYYSGFGEKRPLVRYHLSARPLRNLFCQLALQSSNI